MLIAINKNIKSETGISRINKVMALMQNDQAPHPISLKEPESFTWDECEVLI